MPTPVEVLFSCNTWAKHGIYSAVNVDWSLFKHSSQNSVIFGNAQPNFTRACNLSSHFTGNLSGGAATLDLTALPDGANFSGKKIRGFAIRISYSATGVVTVAKGSSNGYPILGTADGVDGTVDIDRGIFIVSLDDPVPAVSGTQKTVDLSSADSDAQYSVLVAGG